MSRKNRQTDAGRYRAECFNFWLNKMLRVAVSSIKWQGFPDEVDTVYLEKVLNMNGSAICVNDDVLNEIIVGTNSSTGTIDKYGYPNSRSITLANGEFIQYDKENSVIIYNNSLRVSDWNIIEAMARRLADLDVVIRVNCNLQKTVPLIPTTESQRLSVDNIMQQIDGGNLFVPVDARAFDLVTFKDALIMDNAKTFTADQIISIQSSIWFRFLTMMGINNAYSEKKERLIQSEVASNEDEIYIYRRDRLNARERAANEINRKFGLDLKVMYFSDDTNNSVLNIGQVGIDNDSNISEFPNADKGVM